MNLTNYSEIQALLARHGFRFSKSLGQNFLIADWVPRQLAEAAEVDRDTGVLEIGPGLGCLTAQLSERAGKVLAIELDRTLRPVLAETLEGRENVELLFGDVLKQDIPALVAEHLAPLRPVVCANLPYNVTSPVLSALLHAGCFETVTVMVQREVAKRLCAEAGAPDYGAFGILVQWLSEPEILFEVPPSCFVPQPKVTSAIIRLRRRAVPPAPVRDEELLFRLVRAAFNQRRKTLPNALAAGLGVSRQQAETAVQNAGFNTRIRGESVDVVGFAKISDELSKILSADL